MYTPACGAHNFWRSGTCFVVQLCNAEIPPFCLLLQGHRDTLGSLFPRHLVDLAAPVKHDNDTPHGTVSFVAYVEPRTDVLGRSSRHPVMFVSVTGVSVEEGLLLRKIQVGACGNATKE